MQAKIAVSLNFTGFTACLYLIRHIVPLLNRGCSSISSGKKQGRAKKFPRGIRRSYGNCYLALQGASQAGAVKVPHSTKFDAQAVKRQLGIAVNQWDSFMYRMKTLAERKVKSHEAMNYFLKVLCHTDGPGEARMKLSNEQALKKVQTLYDGRGRGAEVGAAHDTAWGLLCAITEFVDHERRARSPEYRLDSAWFGPGAQLKQRALDQALAMVA